MRLLENLNAYTNPVTNARAYERGHYEYRRLKRAGRHDSLERVQEGDSGHSWVTEARAPFNIIFKNSIKKIIF